MTRRKSIISLIQKPCIVCQTVLPMDQFPADRRNIDGHRDTCLGCEEQERLALPQEKACTKCEKVKPLDAYPLDKRNPDGHWNMCQDCVKERRDAYQAEHAEALREKAKAYYDANIDKVRAYNATRRDEQKTWRDEHKEELQLYFKERYAEDPDKFKDYQKKRRQDNPEKVRESEHAKRARHAQAPINDLSEAQWEEIKAAHKHRCVYCGKKDKHLTKDHVTPYKHNGSHTLWNVVPACFSCNSSKRTGDPPVPVQPLLLTIAPARKPKERP